jgi:16S rRNA (uracil1498-N3)-methyltransferase
MVNRFFIEPHQINWQEKKANIDDPDYSHKISRVLRLRENDQITLLDGKGLIYNAQIASFFSRGVQCRLLSRKTINTEPNLKITIAQALLKGSNFDYALQKNTEMGVSEFIPITTERTVIKISETESTREVDRRADRYQKIVRDAAEQSERGLIPKVQNMLTLEELTKSSLGSYDLKLVCLERSQNNGIKDILNSVQDKVQKVLIVIGPEGGFTENESKMLTSKGFTSTSIGKRIYRAETVGTVISSILFFFFNELN